MPTTFSLTPEQDAQIKVWIKEQDAKVMALQASDPNIPDDLKRYAHYGTIGGGYTYSFTGTSLGEIVKVRNAVTKEEIDVTDYDNW